MENSKKLLMKGHTESIHMKDRTQSYHEKNNTRHHAERRNRELVESDAQAVKISFRDVRFNVTIRANKAEIKAGAPQERQLEVLKGVTGFCLPRQVTFIMGASGAGKTSLLNLLSDRVTMKPGMSVTGDILLNDKHPLNADIFANYASYVMQDDVLFPYFTVKEVITFAARLKLQVDIEEQDRRVMELIRVLGLEHC